MSTDVTVQREDYSPVMRAINAVVGAAARLGMNHTEIEAYGIIADAQRATGLTDLGDEDFLEPFETLTREIRAAGFTDFGKAITRAAWVKAVGNRLRFQAWTKAHPEVLGVSVKRPVFVLGFPRSGTTTLQNLLALDPSRRGLQFWELLDPVPSHLDKATDEARRQRSAKWILQGSYVTAPEMKAVHEVGWNTLEECWPLFGNSFAALNFDLQSGLTRYGDLLMRRDMTQAYRDYKGFLQGLLFQRPAEQLVLKCPEHLWFLDALLEVFPDACIVWTHRDPYDSIASYCSLISMQHRNLYGRFDPARLGELVTERFLVGVNRAMAARKRIDPDRFIDVNFEDLVADTPGTVRKVVDKFGLAEDPGTPARVQDWLRGSRGDARGAHHYSPGRYQLNEAEIDSRYAEYIQTYRIPTQNRRR